MTAEWVSAKIAHTAHTEKACYWCCEQIKQGKQYVRWSGKTDGEFWVVRVHPECHAAWQSLPPGEQDVEFGEFARGCTCEPERCKCGKAQR